MDTLMFGGVGLFFILFGLLLTKKHSDFILKGIKISGRVIDVVDKVHISRGTFGQITEQSTIKAPVVEYKYKKSYKFEAEVDVRSYNLTQGSVVEVIINPLKPKTAKLSIGAKESTMIFKLMIGLGIFSCGIGAINFNPNDFNFHFLNDPFTLAIVIITIVYVYLKLWPILRVLPFMPIYHENAVEVDK